MLLRTHTDMKVGIDGETRIFFQLKFCYYCIEFLEYKSMVIQIMF